MNIDEGSAQLAKVVEQFGKLVLQDANEAETRRKVIDQIISGVLGWTPDDIRYEERTSEDKQAEFADYVIRTASTAFVVEAKRAGAAFHLPQNRKSGKLGGFLAEGELGAAIRQARDYARRLSLPFAVTTNGAAWIVFPATRVDGVTFEESQAHIFRNLTDIKDRIVEFWEMLSRQRVIEGSLESHFYGMPKSEDEHRLVRVIKDSGFRLGRNQLYPCVEKAVNLAFTDEAILNDVDALTHCYVRNAERVKYDERLKMHIADARPNLDRKVIRPRLSKGGSKALEENLEKAAPGLPQFLLLLGPVGAGKTTFLHYTQKVSAASAVGGKVIWLYVDYKLATTSDEPKTFLYKCILEYIEADTAFNLGDWGQTIEHAYKEDIEKLKRGALALLFRTDEKAFATHLTEIVMADRKAIEPYVEKILRHVQRRLPIYLVIDNVDQLENEDYARRIFIEAQACARRIGANVIMTLRDATYAKYRSTPVFDAFQMDAIYVDAPSVLPVLSRRFAYAKTILEGEKATFVADNGSKFVIGNLAEFFDVVGRSVLDNPCGHMVEALSGGNVRRCLTLVREFLASEHISADRVLYDYAAGTPSYFPHHEFFKGVVFGQRKFYREEESLLLNIFDSKLPREGVQLLRLHILARLYALAAKGESEGVEVATLVSELYQLGLSEADVIACIDKMYSGNLIRSLDGGALINSSVLIPTRLGGYLFKELSQDFTYLEICTLDASIHDGDTWLQLSDLTEVIAATSGMARLNKRIERVSAFLSYLEKVEQTWLVNCHRYKVEGFSDNEIIKHAVRPAAEKYFEYVLQRAARAFERKRVRYRLSHAS